MSKKVIIMIVVAVLLIAVVVAVAALKASNVDVSKEKEGTTAKEEINLEKLNEELAAMPPFDEMATMDVDSTMLSDVFQVEEDLLEGYVGKFPMMMVHASMYLVVEAKDGEVETVKEQVETYATAYEAQWEHYLPEQYDLVKDRKCGVSGNFVYLFIGESVEEMEKLMK